MNNLNSLGASVAYTAVDKIIKDFFGEPDLEAYVLTKDGEQRYEGINGFIVDYGNLQAFAARILQLAQSCPAYAQGQNNGICVNCHCPKCTHAKYGNSTVYA